MFFLKIISFTDSMTKSKVSKFQKKKYNNWTIEILIEKYNYEVLINFKEKTN